jgi:hypothetical protein
MANAPRKEILDNLATTLAAITTGSGYKQTITTVSRFITDWDSVGPNLMTWCGFMPQRERRRYEPGGMIYCTIPVVIVVHANTSEASRTDLAANIEDDLTKALNADTTRGANAIKTTILDSGSDEANPNAKNSKGYALTVEMNLEIDYLRTVQGS